MDYLSHRLNRIYETIKILEQHTDDLEGMILRIELKSIPNPTLDSMELRVEDLLTILSEVQGKLLDEQRGRK